MNRVLYYRRCHAKHSLISPNKNISVLNEKVEALCNEAGSYNPSSSSFINDIAGNDPEGLLYNVASSDAAFQEELFKVADNTVLEPMLTGSSYIIVRPVAPNNVNTNWTSYLDMMYSASMPSLVAQDIESSILSSDTFEDNFINTYISEVMITQ